MSESSLEPRPADASPTPTGGNWLTRVLIVAARDFRHTVLTKAFLLAIVGVPIVMFVGIAGFALIMASHEDPPLVGTVAVVDGDGALAEAVRLEFELETEDRTGIPASSTPEDPGSAAPGSAAPEDGTPDAATAPRGADVAADLLSPDLMGNPMVARGAVDIDVRRVDPADGATGASDAADAIPTTTRDEVQGQSILAAAYVPPSLLDPPEAGARGSFDLLTSEKLDSDHVGLIERIIGRAVVRVRAERQQLELDEMRALLRRPSSRTRKVLASGEEADQSEAVRVIQQMLIPMAFMMLLWGSTFTGGQHLLNSTIEEKSNKVMEVLLSAVSPVQLMAGKIIGQCLVGLLIMLVYSGLSLAGLLAAARMDLIEPIQLVYLGVYFFMAFFMVASLMAAVGSAVSDLREANSLLMPVMLILMLPLMLWFPISQAPNGAVATTFSFIPPAIPFVMILRIAADEAVPIWQILLSIGWGYACVLGMVWLSGRIFRVGVLMQGKPPSPMELIRWIRYS